MNERIVVVNMKVQRVADPGVSICFNRLYSKVEEKEHFYSDLQESMDKLCRNGHIGNYGRF